MAHWKKYVTFKEFLPGDFEITSKVNPIYNSTIDRSRKGSPTIRNACVARQRAHKALYDVLRANTWKYFITLTFGVKGREDDDYARDLFQKWRKYVRKNLTDMYYVAVPEYHKAGCLHYHIVVGGVSASDLGLKDSGYVLHNGKAYDKVNFYLNGFKENTITGEGLPIYNVSCWNFGFSTCTEIRNTDAVSRYVGKYITKTNIDPRFYNKRHFYTSHNVNRPKVVKDEYAVSFSTSSDPVQEKYDLKPSFVVHRTFYEVYSCDSKEDIIRLRLQGLIPIPKRDLPFKE